MAVAAIHIGHLSKILPETPPEEFAKLICNEQIALPAQGLSVSPLHLPVTWLGSAGEIPLDGEAEARVRKQRQGWKTGPRVLVVSPAPCASDIYLGCAFSPSSFVGSFMRNELERAGIALNDVLVTHAVRFALPSEIKTYKQRHYTDCAPYVIEDIEACSPDIILTLGAQSLKAVLGNKVRLESIRGDVIDYTLKDGKVCKLIPSCSALSFVSSHADIDQFRLEMSRVADILSGKYTRTETTTDYRIITTADGVESLCNELLANPPRHIAFDTEFGNDVAREEFSYTLSIQLSWAKGKAAFIQFRHHTPRDAYDEETVVGSKKDGTPKIKVKRIDPGPLCGVRTMSEADEKRCWAALQRLFLDTRIRLDGHHLRVDVNQFYKAGFPIDLRVADGFDTMLVHYLLKGDDAHGLDDLVRTYLPDFGAYWRQLEEWLTANSRNVHLQYGYRDIPPEILIPYGLKDADATWQLAEILEPMLNAKPSLRHLYWNITSWTSLHLMDVERNGLLVDLDRRTELYTAYKPVLDDLRKRLEKELNWEGFSPSSKYHVAYLLFNQYDYKDRDKGMEACPSGARLENFKPLYNTDKYPKPWDDVIAEGQEKQSTPSTEVDVIDILLQTNPDNIVLKLLQHVSVVSKFVTTYLAPVEINKHGVPEDGKGFHNNIRSDGRVVTRLSQLTSTGRYTSQKANLQVYPKKQESALSAALVFHKFGISLSDYEKRTFDGDSKKNKPAYSGNDRIEPENRVCSHKFKTCIIPAEGYTLIESDFKNAELFIWAFVSGDPDLIKVVTGGRDLHSEVACSSFKLPPLANMASAIAALEEGDYSKYKAWNEVVKTEYESLRVAAKSVNFGIMYGRGARALARALTGSGTPTTEEQCQTAINGVSKNYPVAWKWLQDNMDFAVKEEYIENAFGAIRYFPGASVMPQSRQAAVRREASNAPIQSVVAYLLAQAGINFYKFKNLTDIGKTLDFKVLLPIHDAFLFEVRDDQVEIMKKLIVMCMSTMNKIPGTDYCLGVDIEVAKRWGEKAH